MTPQERKAKLAELAEEIRSLADKDELETTEETRFDEAEGEFTTLKAEDDKYEARMAVAEQARKIPANVIPGDVSGGEGPTLLRKTDPYDLSEIRSLSPEQRVPELRSRALTATEQAPEMGFTEGLSSRFGFSGAGDWQERLSGMLEGGATVSLNEPADGLARHILEHGSPDYVEDFNRYVTSGQAMRAALSTTGSNGGFLIPFFLDPTIILSNAGAINPFRQISRVETISTNVWHGVSSAGVTAEWTSEASEVTDASPTFSQPTVTPIRADAYVQASFEVVADSNIAAQIGMLFADAKDRLEATAFAVGTGSTQPEGLITRLSVTTNSKVATTTNGAYGAPDVYLLKNALSPRWRPNSSWLAEQSIYNLTRQFATGSGPQSAFWADFGMDRPATLVGRGAYESSAMQAAPLSGATASTDYILVLGDFSQYLIVDRIGMEVVYNPLVIGSNRRPTGEVGWAAFWRTGADTTVADAFRMLVA